MNAYTQPLSKLNIFSVKGVQMRTFPYSHGSLSFSVFSPWFGIAPLMPLVAEQLHLTKAQKGNIGIASVSATIIARLIIGRLVDKWGPRKTYTLLLLLSAIPVILIGLSNSYISFLSVPFIHWCDRCFFCHHTIPYFCNVCPQYQRELQMQ
jgi:NNP family nitrate/nitrite transporter-like MFS transporter